MVGEPCGASGLWSGVSGVPGLGVSIPRPAGGPRLAEWDRHCRPEGSQAQPTGPPARRELGARSSSCRSSGRSTASQGSSQPSRHSGHSSSGRRSDSGLSGSGQGSQAGRRRGAAAAPRREGGRRAGRRGEGCGPASLPPPCHCVCTCGDPVPPKPVRRVMFSDESCSCSDEERLRSLPAKGPPVLPARGGGVTREGSAGEEESSGCCSASPVPSHYKSPKDVDGDYSYAYRSASH
jgi:hypothetical protein